jgi:hypothetical protein
VSTPRKARPAESVAARTFAGSYEVSWIAGDHRSRSPIVVRVAFPRPSVRVDDTEWTSKRKGPS